MFYQSIPFVWSPHSARKFLPQYFFSMISCLRGITIVSSKQRCSCGYFPPRYGPTEQQVKRQHEARTVKAIFVTFVTQS
ncbi:hypothetical protein A0H81_12720 [Grifola frondosa]|uniref:Uncharacterized protein n=1 Tax=Grifola frondosa TaxID=5627 RepID=A0A1C7LRN8_GRIFR|nr:hypothetical protein A0H81_12720 [Grifola frondosa]